MATPDQSQGPSRGRSDDSSASDARLRDRSRLGMTRLLSRLTAQLDERDEEIEQLRRVVSNLENEKSKLTSAHRRELDRRQAELTRLQEAYYQFEKESDCLLSELDQQNDRLRSVCREQNVRSLLK